MNKVLPGTVIKSDDHLRVPTAVLVGEYDSYRDAGLNTSPRIDRQQGYTRVDRGQRWISAMRHAARTAGLDTQYEFNLLEHSGHNFLDCMVKGALGHKALEFLLNGSNLSTGDHSSRQRSWTPFIT